MLSLEARIPHAEQFFCPQKHCAHDLAIWSGLHEIFFIVCLNSTDCRFDSGVTWDIHISFLVSMRFKRSSPCSLYRVSKVNALACRFILFIHKYLRHPAWINFRKRSISDIISWRSDSEICGMWRASDEIVNDVFSWIFSSIARTKSLLNRLSAALRIVMHIFAPIYLPLNHSWHVLHTPHKADDECQTVSCLFHSRNGLQTAFHIQWASRFSWIL
jgi:hypothetical protein